MNLYTIVSSGVGSAEAAALSRRLSAWHDAMVAHERKIRFGRTDEICDEECPHADAQALAAATFGPRAQDLTLLRTHALAGSPPSGRSLVSTDGVDAADRGHRQTGARGKPNERRSTPRMRSSERSHSARLEV